MGSDFSAPHAVRRETLGKLSTPSAIVSGSSVGLIPGEFGIERLSASFAYTTTQFWSCLRNYG
jgi:hypothetical protein